MAYLGRPTYHQRLGALTESITLHQGTSTASTDSAPLEHCQFCPETMGRSCWARPCVPRAGGTRLPPRSSTALSRLLDLHYVVQILIELHELRCLYLSGASEGVIDDILDPPRTGRQHQHSISQEDGFLGIEADEHDGRRDVCPDTHQLLLGNIARLSVQAA